jgi:hypothetical protein
MGNLVEHYNEERPHNGRYFFGKTPMETFPDSLNLAKEPVKALLMNPNSFEY